MQISCDFSIVQGILETDFELSFLGLRFFHKVFRSQMKKTRTFSVLAMLYICSFIEIPNSSNIV